MRQLCSPRELQGYRELATPAKCKQSSIGKRKKRLKKDAYYQNCVTDKIVSTIACSGTTRLSCWDKPKLRGGGGGGRPMPLTLKVGVGGGGHGPSGLPCSVVGRSTHAKHTCQGWFQSRGIGKAPSHAPRRVPEESNRRASLSWEQHLCLKKLN